MNERLEKFLQQQRQAHRAMNKSELSIEQRRAQFDQAWQQASYPANTQFSAENIAGVNCEWLRCDTSSAEQPVIVLCHGGGYHIGSCLTHRPLAAQLAHYCKTRVLTIDYRLAPEHKFPAAHDDVKAVVQQLLLQNYRLVLAGDSGGAALAASTAIACAHNNLSGLLLLSPWLDASCSADSYQRYKQQDPAGNRGALRMMAVGYAGIDNLTNPVLSPIYSNTLHNLPPTLLHVGGCETVLDETLLFTKRAQEQGHNTIHSHVYPDLIHGFHNWFNELSESRDALHDIGEWFVALTH